MNMKIIPIIFNFHLYKTKNAMTSLRKKEKKEKTEQENMTTSKV